MSEKKKPARKNPRLHAFLSAIRQFPHIGRAATAAGIARQTHYKRYDNDAEYAKAFDGAWRCGVGTVRDEALRRVLLGYEEPVIYKGQYQYTDGKNGSKKGRLVTVTKYPERLTMQVLRGEHPDTYGVRRVEHTGAGGGPIKREESITLRFVEPNNPAPEPHPDQAPSPTEDDPDSDPSSQRDD